MGNAPPETVAIHQPNFIPWIGYFYKWQNSDLFVFLDDTPFTKGGYTNRVKIKSPNGEQWLTVPVKTKGKLGQLIKDVEINNDTDWRRQILGSIRASYGRAPYFKNTFEGFEEIVSLKADRLIDLNLAALQWASRALRIATAAISSSQIPRGEETATERLLSICLSLGARKYLSGFGGNKYQDEEVFRKGKIELATSNFRHPRYPQMWGDFFPGLSILDLIFNCGPESREIIIKSGE